MIPKDGTEKTGSKGVCVALAGKWIPKQRYVYQMSHPDYVWKYGDVFIHLDEDEANFAPENIMKLSHREWAIFHPASQGIHTAEGRRLLVAQAKLRAACVEVAIKRGDVCVKAGTATPLRGALREARKQRRCEQRMRRKEDPAYRQREKEIQHAYYVAHKEQHIAYSRAYYHAHKDDPAFMEKRRGYNRRQYKKRKERIKHE